MTPASRPVRGGENPGGSYRKHHRGRQVAGVVNAIRRVEAGKSQVRPSIRPSSQAKHPKLVVFNTWASSPDWVSSLRNSVSSARSSRITYWVNAPRGQCAFAPKVEGRTNVVGPPQVCHCRRGKGAGRAPGFELRLRLVLDGLRPALEVRVALASCCPMDPPPTFPTAARPSKKPAGGAYGRVAGSGKASSANQKAAQGDVREVRRGCKRPP